MQETVPKAFEHQLTAAYKGEVMTLQVFVSTTDATAGPCKPSVKDALLDELKGYMAEHLMRIPCVLPPNQSIVMHMPVINI